MQRIKQERRGVRLQFLSLISIIVAGLVALGLLYNAYKTATSYENMSAATEEYIICQQHAANMQAGSDYLTEQVRAFAVTGEEEYLEKYFEEAEHTRRRDTALDTLREYLSDTDAYRELSEALDWSNALMEREYYAMRLVLEAKGTSPEELPAVLRHTELEPQDQGLSTQELMERARATVFDDTYSDYKSEVMDHVSRCLDTLISEMHQRQVESTGFHLKSLNWQYLLIALLLVIVLVIVVLTAVLVVRPLQKSVGLIQSHQPMPVTGAYELRVFADAYNTIIEKNRASQDQLSYEAAHDPLTGLLNRGVFEKMRENFAEDRDTALLLIDVDHFKEINDTYGHDAGDMVLKKLAGILISCFRSEDSICRIGGDEFAVVMVHAGTALRELVENKVRHANEQLQDSSDGVPSASLSVGVAFGDRPNPTEDLYRDADAALYRVKNGGRSGCAFY